MSLLALLTLSLERGASDLHLSAGLSPIIRLDGDLLRLDHSPLDQETLKRSLYEFLTEEQRHTFESHCELDFAFTIPQHARCRVNLFTQEKGIAAAIRLIPLTITPLAQLQLPAVLKNMALLSQGLVLITGAAGSGKSTTLAALVDEINHHQAKHIITLEDPIEFIHDNKCSLIHQREIGRDTKSFHSALRSALREDPDILLVGELRDLETIRLALTAAETGHLVLATLHTNSAAKTINRIIDVFPDHEKNTVRSLLSESLQAVICQELVKKKSGGRIALVEILLATTAIRHLIREDKIAQMISTMQTQTGQGMQTFDYHLQELRRMQII